MPWWNSHSLQPKEESEKHSQRELIFFWHGCIPGCTRWFYCALYFNYNCAVAICSTSFPNYRCKKHFTTPTSKNKKIWGISWQACSERLPFFLACGLSLQRYVWIDQENVCDALIISAGLGCLSLFNPLIILFCYYALFGLVFVRHDNMWLPVHTSFSISILLPFKKPFKI